MVQIVNVDRGPDNDSLFGRALAGFGEGAMQGINYKIDEMLQTRQQAKQMAQGMEIGKQLEKMSGMPGTASMWAAMGPEASMKFMQSSVSPLQLSQQLSGGQEQETTKYQGKMDPMNQFNAPTAPQNSATQRYFEQREQFGENGPGFTGMQQMKGPQTAMQASEAKQRAQGLTPPIEAQLQQVKAPSGAFPSAQQVPTSDEDRFKTVNLFGKPVKTVKSQELIKTPQEAKEYFKVHSPMSKSEQDYKDWVSAQTLETQKGGLELKKQQAEEKRIEPLRKEIDGLRSKVMSQKGSLDISEEMIRQGSTDDFLQFLGQKYGFTPGESTSTAVLNAVQKEFLTGTLGEIGSKGLNQFIEQRILSMMPVVGRSKEANLSVNEAVRYFTDLDKEKIRLFDELEDKVPAKKLQKEIYSKLGDFAENRKEGLSKKLSEIKDEFASDSDLRSTKHAPAGTYLTQKRADALKSVSKGDPYLAQELAIKLGYKLP